MAQAGAGSAEQQCESKADDTKRHDTNLAFQRAYDCSRDRLRPQFMGDGYNFPAFTTMSIKQPMVALPMSAPGQKRTNHRGPKSTFVCCYSNSGQTRVRLDCPLRADTVAKVGGPLQVSNYRIKRARRLNQSCATHRFLESILRVGMRKFFLQQYLPQADKLKEAAN
jgi:hypothetical protein